MCVPQPRHGWENGIWDSPTCMCSNIAAKTVRIADAARADLTTNTENQVSLHQLASQQYHGEVKHAKYILSGVATLGWCTEVYAWLMKTQACPWRIQT